MRLDLIQTVAFAGLMLFVGYGLKRQIPLLARYNIPAPVVGGLFGQRSTSYSKSELVILIRPTVIRGESSWVPDLLETRQRLGEYVK